MLILPAIDLRAGKCVRLTQGDYAQERVYDSDPLRVAQEFETQGAVWIHVVDLDGAKQGEPQNWEAVEGIVKGVNAFIEFGGGVRSVETARRLLDLGVARVVIGTKLVQDPELGAKMFSEFGEEVVAGIDAREGKAAVSGWLEQSSITAVALARQVQSHGARRIILTDIGRDGMLTGPNCELLRQVSSQVTTPVVHSGGIGTLDDLKLLYDMGTARPEGVIVGRAIYEGSFTVAQSVDFLASLNR